MCARPRIHADRALERTRTMGGMHHRHAQREEQNTRVDTTSYKPTDACNSIAKAQYRQSYTTRDHALAGNHVCMDRACAEDKPRAHTQPSTYHNQMVVSMRLRECVSRWR